jgi:hypothetical protein
MKTEKQQASAAAAFASKWEGKGYEKGESQVFWTELVTEVFGVEDPSTFLSFEQQARLDHTSFIDVMIPSTHVMIEQKSIDKEINKPIRQSDGTLLTPFQQAQRYSAVLPYSQRPRWIVISNFKEFAVHDMENPNSEPFIIRLKDLEREYYRLQFLVEQGNEHLQKEMEVSMKAGDIIGKVYDAFVKQYIDPTKPASQRSLNILCVRLVFCLYAEDAGIFGRHDMFHDYLAQFDIDIMRAELIRLFQVLNTKPEDRDPYLREDLAAFPYVNGGLFEGEIEIPRFTEEIRSLLLQNASMDFDWSLISPTIFGAVFESTLNPETRRSGGMHYTSIENIHKVIDPLFLDDLQSEFESLMAEPVIRTRRRKLQAFQDKLASLTFLDPACGSGNFLTETYLSLRRLENKVIHELQGGQMMMGTLVNPVKVSIQQFYGIEINDFAVTVATTALWISEAQMLAETERIVHQDIDFLPLKTYANIREGNALRMDWDIIEITADIPTILAKSTYIKFEEDQVMVNEPTIKFDEVNLITTGINRGPKPPKRARIHYDYIMGNPPFVGARMMDESQKQDMAHVFGSKWKNIGNLDFVCCWYKKAADLMDLHRDVRTAFVSTNSICQGEQVANLWAPLFQDGIHINFAHRTFQWDSEASQKAHVHVVIVGFSYYGGGVKRIFDNGNLHIATNINAYLADAPDVFMYSRQHPIANVPEIGIGNKPIDGGNYLFEKEEMEEFIRMEPKSAAYFKPWYGSVEFIHQKPRYCLWLGDCSPAELRQMPHCVKRIESVRKVRLNSKSEGTRKLADRPTRFHVENMPKCHFIIVPSTSSENRRYIPMGFMPPTVLASNAVHLIPDATLFHFGVLESNVHMAWMRVVCGRLKSDYRYSKDIVYNNFPWPSPTEEQKSRIEQTAKAILDVRAKYPDSSFADLYDPNLMPYDLLKAHRDNDRAVMAAYGFPTKMTESDCVAALFNLYSESEY